MPCTTYPRLFEPGVIGKMRVKNRIVMPPMATNYAGPSGEATDRLIRYYAERAKGGAGLIIVENVQVKYPQGKNVSCQLRLDDGKFIPGFQELAEAVHAYDARIFIQIHHAGRQYHGIEDAEGVDPSGIPDGFLKQPVRPLTNGEILDLIERFSETALRAKRAGLDGVEFHGAHGYLINEFMSPHTNQRVDEWGGTFERRMQFPLRVIQRTREKVGPSFPLSFRFSADEFVPGGITLEDSKKIARYLEDAGIDVLHVSAGIYESMPRILEPMRFEEGWRTYLAAEIRKVVKIPVITVGQIRRPEVAEQILAEGKADFVALGRTLIADPHWPVKAQEGRVSEIRKCISCNIGCIGGYVFNDRYMRCTVNPVTGHERLDGWANLIPAERKKKVMVVGAGPGGMEAARVAALRGHSVTLYEKEGELGGQIRIGVKGPGKGKLGFIPEYYSSTLKTAGVQVKTGTPVDEETIRAEKPDVVIFATGAAPVVPDIRGADNPEVVRGSWDVLSGVAEVPGSKVVVAGGGLVGCETALLLAGQGKDVTIVEMLDELASDMEPITRYDFLTELLPASGVKALVKMVIAEITDRGVVVLDRWQRKSLIEADNVVIALGSRPVDDLPGAARDCAQETYLIGDCREPRRIINATFEGASVARMI
ncbi:MAG TPA: FAD-dependent oxidoreductase [Deltaproteobacteria bacterium]|jgi:2,4-dienoyl-CoA reductase-like NADH-dependent reductase (Old Yellow Enzyme family)/thioredoxin reductase|nr:FAD-dependent oxidoreductase [Deltaproteobacteria bacterium]